MKNIHLNLTVREIRNGNMSVKMYSCRASWGLFYFTLLVSTWQRDVLRNRLSVQVSGEKSPARFAKQLINSGAWWFDVHYVCVSLQP